jgi:hypothetical protein
MNNKRKMKKKKKRKPGLQSKGLGMQFSGRVVSGMREALTLKKEKRERQKRTLYTDELIDRRCNNYKTIHI